MFIFVHPHLEQRKYSAEAGCPLIHPEPDNGKIIYLNSKASALLFCEPNFESVGSIYSHCNGTHWDRVIGTCRETDNSPMTFCDFESEYRIGILFLLCIREMET